MAKKIKSIDFFIWLRLPEIGLVLYLWHDNSFSVAEFIFYLSGLLAVLLVFLVRRSQTRKKPLNVVWPVSGYVFFALLILLEMTLIIVITNDTYGKLVFAISEACIATYLGLPTKIESILSSLIKPS